MLREKITTTKILNLHF